MAEQAQQPFNFQQYLRPRDGRVHPRKALPHVTHADTLEPDHFMPPAPARAMHDHLMTHGIDGYDKPWVRGVKDILNTERSTPGNTEDDVKRKAASEKHWKAMHHAMHDLVHSMQEALQGHLPDDAHMPFKRSFEAHWDIIYRQIDYFHQTYPEEALTTLPSHEEFMAALPDVCRALVKIAPYDERDLLPEADKDKSPLDLERERLERTRGSFEQPLVPEPQLPLELPAPSSQELPQLEYHAAPAPKDDGKIALQQLVTRYPTLTDAQKNMIAHAVETSIAEFQTPTGKPWAQEVRNAIEQQRSITSNQVPLVRLRQGFNTALWKLAEASVTQPTLEQPNANVSDAFHHLLVLAGQVRSNCPDVRHDHDLPDKPMLEVMSVVLPDLIESGVARGLHAIDHTQNSHTARTTNDRSSPGDPSMRR